RDVGGLNALTERRDPARRPAVEEEDHVAPVGAPVVVCVVEDRELHTAVPKERVAPRSACDDRRLQQRAAAVRLDADEIERPGTARVGRRPDVLREDDDAALDGLRRGLGRRRARSAEPADDEAREEADGTERYRRRTGHAPTLARRFCRCRAATGRTAGARRADA